MSDPTIRLARNSDLERIVALLADDLLGSKRERFESPLPDSYGEAFEAIDGDPNHELAVLEVEGAVSGVLQLSYLPSLTYQGSWRGQIEGVRVAADLRGRGFGELLFRWAIERARRRGCRLLQLTTDKSRPDAVRFYRALGFVDSHEGMKLQLEKEEK